MSPCSICFSPTKHLIGQVILMNGCRNPVMFGLSLNRKMCCLIRCRGGSGGAQSNHLGDCNQKMGSFVKEASVMFQQLDVAVRMVL